MTAGIYKCRSTPTGSLPTDQDLYDTMVRGLVTSAMPPWAALTPQQRVDFVAYIKKFSPRFGSEAAAVPIVIPTETPVTIEGLRHGSELYQKLSCARCHGVSGIGDGPDAPTLINFKHQPDPPYDFTITSRFKCGQSNADLYKVLMTGMDGTPMLSFAGKMEPGEAWDLVHYLRTLEVSRKGKENEVLRAAGGRKALASGAPVAP
jgi:mono/diheme cytochrome c family protein